MHKVVIADTSFLIAVHKMQLFNEIRALYKEVYITKKIAEEFQQVLPDWIIIQKPANVQAEAALACILDAVKYRPLH